MQAEGSAEDMPGGVAAPDREDAAPGVRVRVLGRPVVEGVPADVQVRPHALEFLTYLVVRGGSVWQEDVIADLMPEPPLRMAAQRLHTYTYNLRQTFTAIGGARPYLRLRLHQYTLVEEAFDVDVWAMRAAMTEAASTSDRTVRLAALRRAVDLYGAPFAEDTGYLWVTAYREAVRREYVDAAVALAGELDRRGEAMAVLDTAMRHHSDDPDLAAAIARLGRRSRKTATRARPGRS